MIALPRSAAVIAIGLLLLPSAVAREKWICGRTEHFEMFSSASERASRDMLAKLEQFRATALKVFPLRQNREPRVIVILFDTDRQFDDYKPLLEGKTVEVAGYCSQWPDETVIALAADRDAAKACEIIFHEYVHALLAARGDKPPPWLNEGLAELLSTVTITGDSFELGRAKPARVTLLNESSLMPLGQLFAVTPQSTDYNEGDRRGIFYAESWLLLHYLICGEDRETYQPKLVRFLDLLSSPDAVIDRSFHEAFGMDYARMQLKLRSYLQLGSYYVVSGKLALGDLSAQIKFRPATDLERDVELINARWRIRRSGSTAYQLLQLIRDHPDAPRPHEVLAAVAMQEGDATGAHEHWERAAELGSGNAYVYFEAANGRLGHLADTFSLDYRMPADFAAALRGWLDRAIALSPDYLKAYEKLAFVEACAEKPRNEAINRIQLAVGHLRDNSRTLLALAIVRWHAGDYATSRKIVDVLLETPGVSPAIRRPAESLRRRLPPPAPGGSAPPASVGPVAPAPTSR